MTDLDEYVAQLLAWRETIAHIIDAWPDSYNAAGMVLDYLDGEGALRDRS